MNNMPHTHSVSSHTLSFCALLPVSAKTSKNHERNKKKEKRTDANTHSEKRLTYILVRDECVLCECVSMASKTWNHFLLLPERPFHNCLRLDRSHGFACSSFSLSLYLSVSCLASSTAMTHIRICSLFCCYCTDLFLRVPFIL